MKIDVTGSIDQIQLVLLAFESVVNRNGARLDRDATFTLDGKIVENLLAKFSQRDRTAL